MSALWWLRYFLEPYIVFEELVHALVAYPFAEGVAIRVENHVPTVAITWRPGTPVWAVYLAHLAPCILGLLVGLGVLVIAWADVVGLLVPVRLPATGLGVIVVVWWLGFTVPSQHDLRPFG